MKKPTMSTTTSTDILRKDREGPKKVATGPKRSLMVSIDAGLEARFKAVVGLGNVSRYVGILLQEALERWKAEGIIDEAEWKRLEALGAAAGQRKVASKKGQE